MYKTNFHKHRNHITVDVMILCKNRWIKKESFGKRPLNESHRWSFQSHESIMNVRRSKQLPDASATCTCLNGRFIFYNVRRQQADLLWAFFMSRKNSRQIDPWLSSRCGRPLYCEWCSWLTTGETTSDLFFSLRSWLRVEIVNCDGSGHYQVSSILHSVYPAWLNAALAC